MPRLAGEKEGKSAKVLERLASVLRERKLIPNKSDRQVSLFLEVKPQTFANWKSRETLPWDRLYFKCLELSIDFHWLISGENSPEIGQRKISSEHLEGEDLAGISFSKNYTDKLGGADNLLLAKAYGSSMNPTISDKDDLIINKKFDLVSGEIYAFREIIAGSEKEMLNLGRLFLENGQLIVQFDNPAHRTYTLRQGLEGVVGRVVWVGKKM